MLRRLSRNPIITPNMLRGEDGNNINGPSLIAAPEWLPQRLGNFYLYFAHHGEVIFVSRLPTIWKGRGKSTHPALFGLKMRPVAATT